MGVSLDEEGDTCGVDSRHERLPFGSHRGGGLARASRRYGHGDLETGIVRIFRAFVKS